MVCEDLLIRIEAELMSEALDLLHEEVKVGRVKVDGNLVTASEQTSQAENDLFILNKLIEDEGNLRLRYANLVKAVEEGQETNPDVVSRLEEVKRFLLTVSQISMTVAYAKVFSQWFNDAASQIRTQNPAEVLYNTAKVNSERREALEFVVNSKAFTKSEVLNERETGILKEACGMFVTG